MGVGHCQRRPLERVDGLELDDEEGKTDASDDRLVSRRVDVVGRQRQAGRDVVHGAIIPATGRDQVRA